MLDEEVHPRAHQLSAVGSKTGAELDTLLPWGGKDSTHGQKHGLHVMGVCPLKIKAD